MNDLPFISYSMSEPEIQSVLAIHEKLKKSYALEFDLDYSWDLKPLASFEYDQILDSGSFFKNYQSAQVFPFGVFPARLSYYTGKISPG